MLREQIHFPFSILKFAKRYEDYLLLLEIYFRLSSKHLPPKEIAKYFLIGRIGFTTNRNIVDIKIIENTNTKIVLIIDEA